MKSFVHFVLAIAAFIGTVTLVSGSNSNNNSNSSSSNSNGSSSSSSSSNSNSPVGPPTVPPLTGITKSLAITGIDLFLAIDTSPRDSLIISPISVEICLAVLYCGAGPPTEQYLQKALNLQGAAVSQSVVATNYSHILESFNENDLKIATAIFVRNDLRPKESFATLVKRQFHTRFESIDFTNASEAARKINRWVAQETDNEIKSILTPTNISPFDEMFLLNAAYFKGTWQKPFAPSLTETGKFWTGPCSGPNFVHLQMMKQKNFFLVGQVDALQATAIKLPYKSGSSMIVLLPFNCNSLLHLENALKQVPLNEIENNLSSMLTILTLPKFKTDSTTTLNQPLSALGLENIFTDEANLTGMFESFTNNQALPTISSAFQRTIIEVNESGSEAATVTDFGAEDIPGEPGVPSYLNVFNANHPFIYMIIESNVNVFIGRFTGIP